MAEELAHIYTDLIDLSPLRPKGTPRRASPALVAEVRTNGLLQPLLVRRRRQASGEPRFELLRGYPLLAAALLADEPRITARVIEAGDTQARELLHRNNPDYPERNDPIADAHWLQARQRQRLAEAPPQRRGQGRRRAVPMAEIGRELGLSRTETYHRLRLLRLDPAVQALVAAGQLPLGSARVLVGQPTIRQRTLAERAVRERLSVRQVEALVRQRRRAPQAAPPAPSADLTALERELSETLGQPVAVGFDPKTRRGELRLQFFSLEELNGVIERLRGAAPGSGRPPKG